MCQPVLTGEKIVQHDEECFNRLLKPYIVKGRAIESSQRVEEIFVIVVAVVGALTRD